MTENNKKKAESDHILSREERIQEIQRKDEIDPTKRIRYNGSLMDAEFLAKGMDYKDLPDRIHFYISENDIWHCGKAIYPVGKTLCDTGIPYDDSEGELSKRVRYLKKEEGGVEIMCEVSDRIWNQRR